MGGRRLPAGTNGRQRRMHAGADRRHPRGQEGTRRLPDRGAGERAELARTPHRHQAAWARGRARPRRRRRCARLLEGDRGGLSRHQAPTLLGSQDRQRAQQGRPLGPGQHEGRPSRDLRSVDPRGRRGGDRRVRRQVRRQVREGGHLPDQGPGCSARLLLRLPGRALGPSAHVKPDRERVRYSPSSDGADEGIPVGDDRQIDGIQARHRGRKDLAAIEGRKSVAESRPKSQIPKRHRGHRNAGSPAGFAKSKLAESREAPGFTRTAVMHRASCNSPRSSSNRGNTSVEMKGGPMRNWPAAGCVDASVANAFRDRGALGVENVFDARTRSSARPGPAQDEDRCGLRRRQGQSRCGRPGAPLRRFAGGGGGACGERLCVAGAFHARSQELRLRQRSVGLDDPQAHTVLRTGRRFRRPLSRLRRNATERPEAQVEVTNRPLWPLRRDGPAG